MKKDIHPPYFLLKVVTTDGGEFETMSASSVGTIHLSDDKHTHPAWTKSRHRTSGNERGPIGEFNRRFGALNLGF